MKSYIDMNYNVFEITNWILSKFDLESGDAITPLKLQKLLYYIQAWVLADNGKSLFSEDFQAWPHGPAIPEVYRKFKQYGYNAIEAKGPLPDITEKGILDTMEEVIEAYGEHTAKYLERLTHSEDPWKRAREGLSPDEKSENIIKKEWMQEYYSKLD